MWIKHFPVLFNVSSATDMWPFLLLQEEASVPRYIELWGNHRNTNKHFGIKNGNPYSIWLRCSLQKSDSWLH